MFLQCLAAGTNQALVFTFRFPCYPTSPLGGSSWRNGLPGMPHQVATGSLELFFPAIFCEWSKVWLVSFTLNGVSYEAISFKV